MEQLRGQEEGSLGSLGGRSRSVLMGMPSPTELPILGVFTGPGGEGRGPVAQFPESKRVQDNLPLLPDGAGPGHAGTARVRRQAVGLGKLSVSFTRENEPGTKGHRKRGQTKREQLCPGAPLTLRPPTTPFHRRCQAERVPRKVGCLCEVGAACRETGAPGLPHLTFLCTSRLHVLTLLSRTTEDKVALTTRMYDPTVLEVSGPTRVSRGQSQDVSGGTREILLSCVFLDLRRRPHCLAGGPFLHVQSSQWPAGSLSSLVIVTLTFPPPSSASKGPRHHLEPHPPENPG